MNDKLDKLEDIKEENLIWIIYIIIIILSYYANSKEKKYLLYNDEEARREYRSLLIIIFSILVIIYYHFTKNSYEDILKLNSSDTNKKIILTKASFIGTLVEYTEKTFKYYVYNDYSNLNNQLIDRYNFPMKIFYEEIPYIPNIISEIPIDRLNLIVDKTGILIEESKKGKKYLFKIDDIITFIESSKKTILKELNSIYEKN